MKKETLTKEQKLASEWFSNKSYLEQHSLSDKYFESRNPSLLTIEQVEEIWKNEVQVKELSNAYHNTKYLKPNKKQLPKELEGVVPRILTIEEKMENFRKWHNQKQFKQFNESLFKAYIDELPESESLNMIKIIYENKLPDCKFKAHLDKWFKL